MSRTFTNPWFLGLTLIALVIPFAAVHYRTDYKPIFGIGARGAAESFRAERDVGLGALEREQAARRDFEQRMEEALKILRVDVQKTLTLAEAADKRTPGGTGTIPDVRLNRAPGGENSWSSSTYTVPLPAGARLTMAIFKPSSPPLRGKGEAIPSDEIPQIPVRVVKDATLRVDTGPLGDEQLKKVFGFVPQPDAGGLYPVRGTILYAWAEDRK